MILESLIVALGLDSKGFTDGIENAKQSASNLSTGLAKVGGIGLGVASAGIAGITGALVTGTNKTVEWAGELDSIQDILGGTSEEASGLALLMKRIGGNSEQVTGAMKKMTMGLTDTKGELGPTGIALQNLGISAYDANGNLKDAYTIFGEVANSVSGMEDGLAKSQILMDIFGKSGAELGDALNAASNGGMKNFQKEAKELGLAIDPSNVIEMQKAQAKLDATFNGLWITLGSALVPVITLVTDKFQEWLANPSVQTGITNITSGIVGLASAVISYLPSVVQTFWDIGNWFASNPGVIVGGLAAIGTAIIAYLYTSFMAALPALIAFVTASWPVLAVIAAVGAAGYLLYQAWTKDFGGIRTFITDLWNSKLKPIFDVLVTWLQTNIPVAIERLKAFWETVLLPAIQKVWAWMSTTLFPFFQSLGNFLGAVFGVAITALSGLWQNILLPALKEVYSFLNANVFPIFKVVGNWIGEKLTPAFEWLSNAISNATQWFNNMGNAISGLKLPSWLTPGSPMPLTIAMWGLNDSIKNLSSATLPDFATELDIAGVLSTNAQNVQGNQSDLEPYLKDIANKDTGFDYFKMAVTFRDVLNTTNA